MSGYVVWKFRLVRHGVSTHKIPAEYRCLAVAAQGFDVVLWAAVDPTKPTWPQSFYSVFTGGEVPRDAGRYLGVAQCSDGIVVHVFAAGA